MRDGFFPSANQRQSGFKVSVKLILRRKMFWTGQVRRALQKEAFRARSTLIGPDPIWVTDIPLTVGTKP